MTLSDTSTTPAAVLDTEPTSGGIASFSLTNLTTGFHNLVATYNGDGQGFPVSTDTVAQVVDLGGSLPSSTTLTSSSSTSHYGQSVTLTAAVAGSGPTVTAPSGSVTFVDQGMISPALTTKTTVLGTVALSGGTAALTTSALSAPLNIITAYYSGDSNFAPSTASVQQKVSPFFQTTLTSSRNPSAAGQSITFTADVALIGGTLPPFGAVQFAVDGTNVGSRIAPSRGQATYTETGLTPGTHTVTVTYIPFSQSYPGSKTASLTQTVTPDLAANPQTHLLWTSTDGTAAIWTLDGAGDVTSTPALGPIAGWTARSIADGSDGLTRLLWTKQDGESAVWTIDTATDAITSTPGYGPIPGWNVASLAVGPDDQTRLLWASAAGESAVWTLSADGSFTSTPGFGPIGGWATGSLAVGSDGLARLLWADASAGQFAVWSVDALSDITSTPAFGPAGFTPTAIAGGPDANARLLLNRTDGAAAVWTVTGTGGVTSTPLYGPISNWAATGLAVGPDALSRVLWSRSDGGSAVWTINADGSVASTPLYGPIAGWNAVALSVGP